MLSLEWLLRIVHVSANLFWIGSIVAVGVLLSAPSGTAKERGVFGARIYRVVASPAFGISFLAALVRLFLTPEYYFVTTHFMHAKLPLALGAVALHFVIGARAKRMAAGRSDGPGPASKLTALLVVLALGSAWLALAKPF